MTVSQWLTRWIDLRAAALAPRTIESYRGQLRLHIAPTIGALKLTALRPEHIANMLLSLRAAGQSRTAQLCFIILRAALADAVRSGRLRRNPCDALTAPRHRPAPPRWWTPDELRAFIAASRERPFAVAWQLALCCGLRRGELIGLRWVDVDHAAALLRIRNQRQRITGVGIIDAPPKSEAGIRDIPVPSALLALLDAHALSQQAAALLIGAPSPRYVVSPDGRPITPERLGDALAADIAAAGVRPINLHGLRHSMATLAVSLEVPMRVLQSILGHADYSTTANTYSHVLQPDQAAAVDKITRYVV